MFINRLSPESGKRKMVDMQILSPRFRPQQLFLWKICRETFSPNLWGLYGDAMLGANMAAGNQQKHMSLRFATKS